MFDTCVLIGRFQPVHAGHLALLEEALRIARNVVVVLGSAHAARSVRNPFTWQERQTLVQGALPASALERVRFAPVRDYYDEARWSRAVVAAVEAATNTTTAGQATESSMCIVGHFKDASSGYLRSFPDWSLHTLPRQGLFDATPLRDAWLGGDGSLATEALPPHVTDFLQTFAKTEDFARLQEEWHALQAGRALWVCAPYPPIFVTVDALVHDAHHVLLIRRGRAPGRDLLALPGGFIDEHESLLQSCLRELAEETHCAVTEADCARALQQVRVFAHPARSQRGRTITHVHRFDLTTLPGRAPGAALPAVRADDDAAHALWVPITELPQLEDQFFEDHFHVLDVCLGVLPVADEPSKRRAATERPEP